MTNKNIKLLNDNLVYFKNVSKKLSNPDAENGQKLVDLFGDITNHIATLTDNIDFPDEFDPANAISGDNGDIEDGANMLYYYRQLMCDEKSDDTDKISALFQGGARIQFDDELYVNYAYDDPSDVEEETPEALRNGVVSDVIYDLKSTLNNIQATVSNN